MVNQILISVLPPSKYLDHYIRITDWIRQIRSSKKTAKEMFGYIETHHKIPRSWFACSSRENIIHCTAREHFILHRLLEKATRGTEFHSKSVAALVAFSMANRSQRRTITARQYSLLRTLASDRMRGTSNPRFGRVGTFRGEKHTEQAKEKMREAAKKRVVSLETRRKMSERRKGKDTGIEYTTEVRAKMREQRASKIWITNGTMDRAIPITDDIPEGWRRGRSKGVSGSIANLKPNAKKAQTTKKSRKWRFYNNGQETKMFMEGLEPEGWIRGIGDKQKRVGNEHSLETREKMSHAAKRRWAKKAPS
jgi:hypothetical protein